MNTAILASDIKITPDIVKTLLLDQFNITVQQLKLLGEGWDNSVYLINNSLVFRFPRRKEAISLVKREMAVLPALERHISLKIPKPAYFGKPSNIFNRPFYGHELIYGRSGCSVNLSPNEYEELALDLARFLKNLHQIRPTDLGLVNGCDPAFDRTDKNRMFKELENRLSDINKHYDLSNHINKFNNIKDSASAYQTATSKTFIHGDLYHRHLLFDDNNKLSGIIDWGDCCIGDPVADLGIVFQFLSKTCHETFFAEYGHVDKSCFDYARFLGLYYAVALLWYGHDRSDQDLIRTSLWTFSEL